MPDAKATSAYLEVIRCISDAYLDKNLNISARIRKAWYAAFFLRYWRHWLLLSNNYTLGSNFVTLNAYMCVEINAHSLVTYAITLRDIHMSFSDSFCPWLFGSQTCEKIFRAARSMTSTFSTVINFGILALLRRLHRLHMQFSLESEADRTGIIYPRACSHKKKEGHNKSMSCNSTLLTNEEILEAVEKGRSEAQSTIESLGMAKLLQDNRYWEYPPIPKICNVTDDDDDDEEDDNIDESAVIESMKEVAIQEEADTIASEIKELTKASMISTELNEELTSLHKSVYKRLPGTLPLYSVEQSEKKMTKRCKSHDTFIPIEHNGKQIFIHKVTAVWLFQEGERVSSDRLFRVRSKQPHSHEPYKALNVTSEQIDNKMPVVCETIQIGDVCVFSENEEEWKLGRVVKFAFTRNEQRQRSSAHLQALTSQQFLIELVLCALGLAQLKLKDTFQWEHVKRLMSIYQLPLMCAHCPLLAFKGMPLPKALAYCQ